MEFHLKFAKSSLKKQKFRASLKGKGMWICAFVGEIAAIQTFFLPKGLEKDHLTGEKLWFVLEWWFFKCLKKRFYLLKTIFFQTLSFLKKKMVLKNLKFKKKIIFFPNKKIRFIHKIIVKFSIN